MKYGFKIKDQHGEFTRWFSSNGEFTGIMTPEMKQVIVAQHFLVFHQAYAYAKSACLSRGIQFTTLYEQDYKKLGNPIIKFLKKLFK
jgi:hypothetical protein